MLLKVGCFFLAQKFVLLIIICIFAVREPAKPLNDAQMCGSFCIIRLFSKYANVKITAFFSRLSRSRCSRKNQLYILYLNQKINIHPKSALYVKFHFLLISSTSACSFSRLALLCSGVKLSTRFISLTKRSASLPIRIGVSLIGLAIFISSYYFDVCIFLCPSSDVCHHIEQELVGFI